MFRRLSVFAGGFTLDAAQYVCAGDGIEGDEVLDLLTHLVDKSLVVAEARERQARYRLLETVRQYGETRLLEAAEVTAVRGRHLNYFLTLAEQADAFLRGPDEPLWLDRLETELDNMRAALQWSLGTEDVQDGLRLAGALAWFWRTRGHLSEGRAWLERTLSGRAAMPSARARALLGAASVAFFQGDYARSASLAEESLAIWRELGHKWGMARALSMLGYAAYAQSDYERAARLSQESVTLGRELGDGYVIAFPLVLLGNVAEQQGNYVGAAALYRESLALRREVSHRWGIASSLRQLGRVALHQRDFDQATTLYKESLIISHELADRSWIAACLDGLAGVAGAQAQFERAARLFGAADALREPIGAPPLPFERADYDRSVSSVRAALGETAFAAAWAQGRAMTLQQAVEHALEETNKQQPH